MVYFQEASQELKSHRFRGGSCYHVIMNFYIKNHIIVYELSETINEMEMKTVELQVPADIQLN